VDITFATLQSKVRDDLPWANATQAFVSNQAFSHPHH